MNEHSHMSQALAETAHLRQLLQKKEADLIQMRTLAKTLLHAYVGTLRCAGAVLATNPEANPLIQDAKDLIGLLQ